MGYWNDAYGRRSKEFVDGVIAGVVAFAVWINGEQVVGCMRKPLGKVIEEIKKDFNYKEGE